ncbi:MAG: hypothetical protein FWG51_04620 [Firmicutes bacterium]|nr:hypothetical protein [Bacillota bacterium]
MNPATFVLGGVLVGSALIYSLYKIAEKATNNPITFDDYVDRVSKKVDESMLNSAESKGNECVGGKCIISVNSSQEPNLVIANIEIYSKDSNEQWEKTTMEIKTPLYEFSDSEPTQSKIKSLLTESIELDFEPPTKQ